MNLEGLLKSSCEKVLKNDCWKKETRGHLSGYFCSVSEELCAVVNRLAVDFHETSDPEKFFEEFCGDVTASSCHYLDGLPLATANLVMIHFGELIFGHLKKLDGFVLDEITPLPITESEKDALQYVAGFVVHKFLKKVKNLPTFASPENQLIILILESMIDVSRENKLVDALSRGGLITISSDCELIFIKTEEIFRMETSKTLLRKIDILGMTSSLINQPDIISLTNNIIAISGCDIDPESKSNLFEKMMQLYLRVRTYSWTSDFTSKNKSGKTKGLRKEIKRSMGDPT